MKNRSPYDLDGVPVLKEAIPLGLQHILAMFVSNLAPILIVGGVIGIPSDKLTFLIQCTMFVSGINTLIQAYRIGPIGARLPVVVGTSFAFVPIAISIGLKYGFEGVLGAALVGGVFEAFIGLFMRKIRKFFPPIVTGVVVLSIGLSLVPVGIQNLAGGVGASDFGSLSNLFLGGVVLVTVIIFNQFAKGIWKTAAIAVGTVIGVVVAGFMGKIDFATVSSASNFVIPKPLTYGLSFHLDAIFAMMLMYVVSAVETVGDMSGVTMGGANREVTNKELSGGILADGLGGVIAALFSILPTTSFSQNTGIVAMTGIMSRFVVGTGAMFLIIGAFIPKIGALISIIPASVIGGSLVMLFAMITVSGINLITIEKLVGKNAVVVAVALGVGFGMGNVPEALQHLPESLQLIFGGSGIVVSAGIAVVLNVVLPESMGKKKIEDLKKV